jgi:lipase chaperone LimK
VATDESRSAEERARDMVMLERQLPEDEREARAAALAPLQLGREEARLRAEGGSREEIRALRESYFGVDAAARLDALDRKRQAWQQRITTYREDRAAIEHDPALSADERAARVARLLDGFTAAERMRFEALDHIAGEHDEPPQ